MRVLVVASLLTMLLAGCAEAPEEATQAATAAEIEAGTAAPLPEWSVGMFWEFEHLVDGEPAGIATYVVTDVGTTTYTLDVNDKSSAEYEARYDISYIGPIRKSDLAGSQGGQPVAMFEFPLSADKEWTTTWDGETLNMVSSNMGPMQFHVMGHRASDGEMLVEYHYNALKSWFEYIVFYNGTTGDESFRMTLNNHGTDFKGQVYRYTMGETRVFTADSQNGGIQDVHFAEEWNELHASFDVFCRGDSSGQNLIGVNPPEKRAENPGPMLPFINDPEYGFVWDCADGQHGTDQDVMINTGGDWELGMLAGGPNALVHVMIEERHLETITL